jgi:hypothetical protein
MCTVSVIHIGDPIDRAVRVVCNRDELRSRPPARPPEVRQFGTRRAIMPIDPASDGTWIAASDAGLVMTLLNRGAAAPLGAANVAPLLSRGTMIPPLLHSSSLEEAVVSSLHLRPGDYQPFRLVILDLTSCCEVISDGTTLRTFRPATDGRPLLLFTSSGLGDDFVERPRRELFEQLVPPTFPTPAAQDSFHRHAWAGREYISVQMSRAEARTVSRTTIELSPRAARMMYESLDDPAWTEHACHLSRT